MEDGPSALAAHTSKSHPQPQQTVHTILSHSPGHFSRVISPRLSSLSSHQWETQENFRLVFQGRFQRICTSRYKKMIKISMIKHILGINQDIGSPKRVGSPGYQCLTRECVLSSTKPSQRQWQSFQVCIFHQTNLLDIWPKLGSAQLSSGHVQSDTLVLQNTKMFKHWPNFNTWIKLHFYFMTRVLTN